MKKFILCTKDLLLLTLCTQNQLYLYLVAACICFWGILNPENQGSVEIDRNINSIKQHHR